MTLHMILRIFLVLCLCSMGAYSQSNQPQPNIKSQEQQETWTCPMHPQVKDNKPGQCPICGMNLVKVQTLDNEMGQQHNSKKDKIQQPDNHVAFSLEPERQQMIGVKFGIAEKKQVFKSIYVAGRLAFDPELYTAQNEYKEALWQLEKVKNSPLPEVKRSAENMVSSSKMRLKILGLTDKQIDRISTEENSETNLLLYKAGQQAWVYAEIYEMDLPNVQPGQSATISADFLEGEKLVGEVISIDQVVNATTRTAKARILINKTTTVLRPESYVDVAINAPLGMQVVVPFDAVLSTGRQTWVFVVDEKNNFIPKLITIKFYANDEVAIASGLKGGEKIVTSANFLIDSESRIKALTTATRDNKDNLEKQPSCPKDQHWDVPMAMCMPN